MSTTDQPIAVEQSEQRARRAEQETPPVGEEIHLPGPSILPLTTAAGITLVVIGTTIGLVWIAIGLALFFVSAGIWIRDVIRDVDALPEEHHH